MSLLCGDDELRNCLGQAARQTALKWQPTRGAEILEKAVVTAKVVSVSEAGGQGRSDRNNEELS